jgi:hypothetical protein
MKKSTNILLFLIAALVFFLILWFLIQNIRSNREGGPAPTKKQILDELFHIKDKTGDFSNIIMKQLKDISGATSIVIVKSDGKSETFNKDQISYYSKSATDQIKDFMKSVNSAYDNVNNASF